MAEEGPRGSKLDSAIAQAKAEITQAEITIQNLTTRITRLETEIIESKDLLKQLEKV